MLTDTEFCDPYIVARLVSDMVPLLRVVPVPDLFILSVQSLFYLPRVLLDLDLLALGEGFSSLVKLLMRVPHKNFRLKDIESQLSTLLKLYGELHSRFVNTEEGLAKYYDAYKHGKWGVCGGEACRSNVVPFQHASTTLDDHAKFYCLECDELYDESYFASAEFPEKQYYPSGLLGNANYIGPNVLSDFLKLHAKKLHRKRNKKKYKRKLKYGIYKEFMTPVYEKLVANDFPYHGYQQQIPGDEVSSNIENRTIHGFRVRRRAKSTLVPASFSSIVKDPVNLVQEILPGSPTRLSTELSDENPKDSCFDLPSSPTTQEPASIASTSTTSLSCEHRNLHLEMGVPVCTHCKVLLQNRAWNAPPSNSRKRTTGGLRYVGRELAEFYARVVRHFPSQSQLLQYIHLSGEKLVDASLLPVPQSFYSHSSPFLGQSIDLPTYTLLPFQSLNSLQISSSSADKDRPSASATTLLSWLQDLTEEQASLGIFQGEYILCETSVLIDTFDDHADEVEEAFLSASITRILSRQ